MRTNCYFESTGPATVSSGTAPRPIFTTRRGFTLVELLVVVCVIGLLLALAGSSLTGAMQGMAITNAGNKVAQIFDAARQRAMTANVLTAAVIITKAGTQDDGRAMSVFEYSPGGTSWRQVTEWTMLAEGITVDVNNNPYSSFIHQSDPLPFISKGGINYQGKSLGQNAYASRVFVPSGGLLESNQASQLQVVEGTSQNGSTTYTKVSNGTPVNYYRLIILGATGKTKIERPEL